MNRAPTLAIVLPVLAVALSLPSSAHAGNPPTGGLQPPPGPVAPTPGPNSRIIIDAQHTPGDGTSRYIIDTPGSYRVASAHGFDGKTNLLRVTATNVDIEMNGNSFNGGLGAGTGIIIDLPNDADAGTITIRNGTVKTFVDGIKVANVPTGNVTVLSLQRMNLTNNADGLEDAGMPTDAVFDLFRVNASNNSSRGIAANFTVTRGSEIIANKNGEIALQLGTGVVLAAGSNLKNVIANENGLAGIAIDGGQLQRITVNKNGGNGVIVTDPVEAVEITDVNANGNTNGHGVKGTKNTRVRGGSARGNEVGVEAGDVQGVDTGSNTLQGIKILSFGRAQNSFSEGNGLCGIELAEGARAVNCAAVANQTGVLMSDGAQLWQSTVSGNTGDGVEATGWIILDAVNLIGNGDDGAEMQSGFVRGTWAAMNTGNGINGGDFLHIKDSAADGNGVRGFVLGQLSEISDCCTHTNAGGIFVAGGSRVMGNIIAANGVGIETNGAATIEGNTVSANATDGVVILVGGDGTRIIGNVIKSHASGNGVSLAATRNTVMRNTFSGNMADVFNPVTGNKVAPIQCDPLTAGLYDNWAQ